MNIRRLTSSDYDLVMDYLFREPEYNLFIIGDIENFGFKCDFQDVYGALINENEFGGVLLRYHNSWVVYATADEALPHFAAIIEKTEPKVVSAKHETAEKLLSHFVTLPVAKVRSTYLARMDRLDTDLAIDTQDVYQASVEDVNKIIELRRQISEFADTQVQRESVLNTIKNKAGRTYCINRGGRIVSSAASTSENSRSAMVVGVATLAEYRNQGLASACVYRLCSDLLAEGKVPCLFYDNPQAGRIYRHLGFREMGKWDMIIVN